MRCISFQLKTIKNQLILSIITIIGYVHYENVCYLQNNFSFIESGKSFSSELMLLYLMFE